MIFTSYRNILNFYFSSAALSSSLINCLYMFYLAQTLRSKALSENNCRAMYYLQTSCIVVLAYTITVMHANFVLCLFFPSSDQHQSNRTCLQSCGVCLRRSFRRFCFCLVLLIWSLSFTATIPLLYTIDSNEKIPRPVYCPGSTERSYLEEWFDHNRLNQTVLFNLIPLLTTIFLTLITLLKLFCDWLAYIYARLKMSKCSPCRKEFSNQQRHRTSIPHSMTMLSSLGMLNNSITQSGFILSPIIESPTPTPTTDDITISSSDLTLQPCRHWCSTSSLNFLLVISCCLLACIYPIAMRFYLVYFSVLVPLIFAVFNYSSGQLTSPTTQRQQQQEIIMENHNMVMTTTPRRPSISPIHTQNIGKIFEKESSTKPEGEESSTEQFELRSSLIENLSNEHDGREQFVITPTSSSQSSTICPSHYHRLDKQKYFSNHLYENTRNMLMK